MHVRTPNQTLPNWRLGHLRRISLPLPIAGPSQSTRTTPKREQSFMDTMSQLNLRDRNRCNGERPEVGLLRETSLDGSIVLFGDIAETLAAAHLDPLPLWMLSPQERYCAVARHVVVQSQPPQPPRGIGQQSHSEECLGCGYMPNHPPQYRRVGTTTPCSASMAARSR
jgi:hypothetical protein